jgi:hypothetical protein
VAGRARIERQWLLLKFNKRLKYELFRSALPGDSVRLNESLFNVREALRMALKSLTRLRRICLALPRAFEQETWGEATFRVRDKVVAREDEDGTTFSCKAPPGSQHAGRISEA